jgi:hypothetical protein
VKWTVQFFFILMSISLLACQRDIPEPETRIKVVSAAELSKDLISKQGNPFQVRSFVKGNDVYIECFISNFSFRKEDKKGNRSGKMLVYVDGKKYNQYSSAAFIVKDLTTGNHRITLQLVDSNGQKTAMKRELVISIS